MSTKSRKLHIKDPSNSELIHCIRVGPRATAEKLLYTVAKLIRKNADEILIRNREGALIDLHDNHAVNTRANAYSCQIVKLKESPKELKESPKELRRGSREQENKAPRAKGRSPGKTIKISIPDKFPKCGFEEETLEFLKIPSFDVWSWDDEEMIALIYKMYEKLGLIEAMDIIPEALEQFILEVRGTYRENPFHNFRHAFCVTQMWYGLVHTLGMVKHYTKSELFCMLTAALCHDMDHPGYSNSYLINSKSELALRYNDQSPLENHHAATCFKTIAKQGCNILQHKSREDYRVIRNSIVQTILATDMAYHSTYVADWNSVSEKFDPSDEMHRFYLMRILIKVSDISNEARPASVSDKWLDRLLDEYFHQGDIERSLNLPTLAFMDRTKTTRSSAQIGFISFVLIPFFQTLLPAFPMVEELLLVPVKESLQRFKEMADEGAE